MVEDTVTDGEAPIDDAIVEARMAWTRALALWPLGPEEDALVRRRVARRVEAGRRLRQVPLGNADEPDGAFVPDRVGDGPPG
jgi:hypothetical protein